MFRTIDLRNALIFQHMEKKLDVLLSKKKCSSIN